MTETSKNRLRPRLICFIIITLISGWLGVLLDSLLKDQPKGSSLGMGLWLVLPFLTAFLLRITGRDWKNSRIRLNLIGNIKWYAVGLLIYPIVTIITLLIAWLFGVIQVSNFESSLPISVILVSFLGNFIKNIFEEFSWRGYLTPKLIELKLNDWLIYLVSGIIWALWHTAYYLVFLPEEYFTSLSRTGTILSGCVLMVAWAVMYVEIYRLTNSVWPCVLMHAAEDAVPTLLMTISGAITLTKNGDIWLNPASGVVATVLFLGIGLILRSVRIKKDLNIFS
ncbi:CAAX protease self-immunity [Bacillus sp. 491mf]|uniref:CPBP family glutamic-type intramembrane protease n=1 Tax=Bacillus sp. 491mf TaxID=1761755 RepID=UPI0008E7AD55|nr:CPBP family glutamic-type intramembrane protease [Bacillus sp. 491mf]SFC55851.1 CAAX protease self-immunity [Bacillus sp. 491mf]